MANDQFTLFDDNVGLAPEASKGLMVAPRLGQRLTKAQETFNRLVKRVEALRTKIADETKRLDAALVYYGQHLHPRRQRQAELRKRLARLLATFFDNKRFKGKRDRATLCEIIASQLDEILMVEQALAEEDLCALFERVNGQSLEDMERAEFEATREEIASAFDDLGLNIDLSDMKPGMSDEAMFAKAAEMKARLEHEMEELKGAYGAPPRRKTQRQLAKEERERLAEETRKKTVASLYKQLARVLHPDLEQDAELKKQKEIFMQQLTVAYHDNDMHTLLRLEVEWIAREEGNIDRLTDEKLAIYNQTLKEQVQELEDELQQLPLHPKYEPIVEPDGPFNFIVKTDGPAEARALDQTCATLEEHIADLQSSDGLALLKAVLKSYREDQRARPWQLRDARF